MSFYKQPTRQKYVPRTSWEKKRRPMDVPYGPLFNTKGRPLPTSWRRPLSTSFGHWNMASWGRPNVTSWGRSHNVLYVTSRYVPCRRLEDVCCRRYEDVPTWSSCNSKGRVLPTSWGHSLETSGGRPKDVLIWF